MRFTFKWSFHSNFLAPVASDKTALEYRGHETTALSCFSALLRSVGEDFLLDDLLSVAPIPKNGMSDRLLHLIARRVGIRLVKIDPGDVSSLSAETAILVQRASHYSFLIWSRSRSNYSVGLPGHAERYATMALDSDVLENVKSVYAVSVLESGVARIRRLRPQRLWLMPWIPEFDARYDAAAVMSLKKRLARTKVEQLNPIMLSDFKLASLLAVHLSICPGMPEYYGRFREINLRRDKVFVNFRRLRSATENLLNRVDLDMPQSEQSALEFAARLFVDFLSIHPFLNGNRRMGMRLVSAYLAKIDRDVAWENIGIAECYYWYRLASAGHLSVLVHGFRSRLVERGVCA